MIVPKIIKICVASENISERRNNFQRRRFNPALEINRII